MPGRVVGIDGSYMSFNLKCLTLTGLWNPFTSGPKFWIYVCYICYVNLVIMFLRAVGEMQQLPHTKNFSAFISTFTLTLDHILCTIKSTNLPFHKAKIFKVIELFNWERRLLCPTAMVHYRNKILTDTDRVAKIFTATYWLSAGSYSMFYSYDVYCTANGSIDGIPLSWTPARFFFPRNNFLLVWTCDFLTLLLLAANAVMHDSFFVSIVINVAAQLKLLNYRLENCGITAEFDKKKSKNRDIIHFDCNEETSEERYIPDANKELVLCIQHYQKIIELLDVFKSTYRLVLLPQLGLSLLIVSLSSASLLINKKSDWSDKLDPLSFVICSLIQIYLYCWSGDKIREESEKTSESIQATKWYNENKLFHNDLKVFMALTRNPLIYTVSGMIDLTVVTFKNILVKAYSFIAMINTMND